MHIQLSQFRILVKINSQRYSNPIPSDFEPMIIHWVQFLESSTSKLALSSIVLRLLMNHILFLRYNLH